MKKVKNNRNKRFILLAIVVFLGSQLFAAEAFTLKGKVQNNSNENIKNAIVTLTYIKSLEPAAITKCNKSGEFFFENVVEGEYILTVQKDGISRAKSKIISLDETGKVVEKKVKRTETFLLIDAAS